MFLIHDGIAVIIGASQETTLHSHYAIQLSFILSGEYDILIADKHISDSVYINSNIPHSHKSDNGRQMSIFIEPDSYIGKILQYNYPDKYQKLCYDADELSEFLRLLSVNESSSNIIKGQLCKILDLEYPDIELDSRIKTLLAIIESEPSCSYEVNVILSEINLSESRARHLFKEQTGISLKRYLLWKKLKDSVVCILQGEGITDAAYLAGFADSSHMNHTFRDMFGISPSDLLKDSRSIQDFSTKQ